MSGRGKKDCPGCNTEMGVRTRICPTCEFDFSTIKKKVVEKKKKEVVELKEEVVKEVAPAIQLPAFEYKPVSYYSPMEHANKILGYGKERALNLLKCHISGQTWSHVDWKIVEEGLK